MRNKLLISTAALLAGVGARSVSCRLLDQQVSRLKQKLEMAKQTWGGLRFEAALFLW
jgi:hypothetical protein